MLILAEDCDINYLRLRIMEEVNKQDKDFQLIVALGLIGLMQDEE